MLSDGLGAGGNDPSPCLASLTPHPLLCSPRWVKDPYRELLSCSQGLKSVGKICTEQPESLSSQAGRSEPCQKLLAPSPSLML